MMKITSIILLLDGVKVLCAVIAASSGNWASSVVSLVALVPLAVVARWLAKGQG